jgi:hypothetical protein
LVFDVLNAAGLGGGVPEMFQHFHKNSGSFHATFGVAVEFLKKAIFFGDQKIKHGRLPVVGMKTGERVPQGSGGVNLK